MSSAFDYVLCGGGLQNGLLALAVRSHAPDARIALIERGPAVGGNHTWCFHANDIDDERAAWIDPLVAVRWEGYDVAFPAHARSLASPYACVTSERLATHVAAALDRPGSQLFTSAAVIATAPGRVTMRDARGAEHELTGYVVDARGPDVHAAANENAPSAWQKFLGQELVLSAPHGLTRPILMDATVEQLDGFRFVYVLPLAPDRLLVEDTYFSDTQHLDAAELRERIGAYVARQGWAVREVAREEVGVLGLPLRMSAPVPPAHDDGPLVAGYAGGWFHPVTGYSFPIASRLAQLVATTPRGPALTAALVEAARAQDRQLGFALKLNHMLFRWFAPAQRFRVLERFYRLPEPAIRRFYALSLTTGDRLRILVGRPPRGLSLRGMLGGEAR